MKSLKLSAVRPVGQLKKTAPLTERYLQNQQILKNYVYVNSITHLYIKWF